MRVAADAEADEPRRREWWFVTVGFSREISKESQSVRT